MTVRVCLAGATGWAGAALARAIVRTDDLELVAGVSLRHAGRSLGEDLAIPNLNAPLCASAEEALTTPCDVFVEYTRPEVAKANVSAAIRREKHVVIGTSGLSEQDLEELSGLALEHRVGVLAVGNFSLANLVMQKCAELAAKHISQWEILDYAAADKPDSPSGTGRELANRLARIRRPYVQIPVDQTQGPRETRGATLDGTQVHSIRLPGYVISVEALFGDLDQRVTIRYDAGSSPECYVEGAILSIRRVSSFVGLKRGLDSIMEI